MNPDLSFPVAALLRQAADEPDRVVLIAGDTAWTSGQLADQSGRLAAGLVRWGVRAGDRVALHLHNTPAAVLAYLACLRVGAVAVPLNARLAPGEIEDLVERTRPVAYLGESALYSRFAPVSEHLVPQHARFVTGRPDDPARGGAWPIRPDGPALRCDVAPDPGAPALLLSTSGTSGRSKIGIWSHRTLANLHLSAAGRGIGRGDVLPVMTPLMHSAGVYHLFNALTQGGTAVLVRRFDAGAVLDAVRRRRITSLFGLPFMCAELVREQRERPRDVSSLTVATVAGDTCPAEVEADFGRTFGVPLRSFWAATEDVGATITDTRVGPYLRIIPEATVRIVDADSRDVVPGGTGEMLIGSPTTSPGYWNGPEDRTPIPDGIFATGDLVREREPGVLEYLGRAKDLIIRGGSNISPREVEEALRGHPDVVDAGVAGLPDPVLGQRVGALLVLGDDAARRPVREIIDWLAERIAAYKLPERVAVVEAIPRNALTKVDRAGVRRELAAHGTVFDEPGSAAFTPGSHDAASCDRVRDR
jgi:long-chain acyl-CoA synthetase